VGGTRAKTERQKKRKNNNRQAEIQNKKLVYNFFPHLLAVYFFSSVCLCVYWINKFSRFPNAAGRVLDRRKVDGVVREEEERGPRKGPLGAKRGGVTSRPSLGKNRTISVPYCQLTIKTILIKAMWFLLFLNLKSIGNFYKMITI